MVNKNEKNQIIFISCKVSGKPGQQLFVSHKQLEPLQGAGYVKIIQKFKKLKTTNYLYLYIERLVDLKNEKNQIIFI